MDFKRSGLQPSQKGLAEMITHLAFYVGWPNAMSAVNRAKALFESREGT